MRAIIHQQQYLFDFRLDVCVWACAHAPFEKEFDRCASSPRRWHQLQLQRQRSPRGSPTRQPSSPEKQTKRRSGEGAVVLHHVTVDTRAMPDSYFRAAPV